MLFAPAAPISVNAGASISRDELVPAGALLLAPVATAVAVKESPTPSSDASQPKFAAGGKLNLRRHVRTRVNFIACIRLSPASEDIVEISKGGLCFQSRHRYEQNSSIEVAVPYYSGQPSIFIRVRVVRVEELPGLNLFRYGVSYA